MNNLPGLIDLTPVMAVLTIVSGSAFSASNVLQFLRNLLLDALTAHMPDKQRNDLLRVVLFVINYAMILVAALFLHFAMSPTLLLSVGFAALVAAGSGHYAYGHNQKTTAPADPAYAEIPADAFPAPTPLPEPPTDSPQSAALDAAA